MDENVTCIGKAALERGEHGRDLHEIWPSPDDVGDPHRDIVDIAALRVLHVGPLYNDHLRRWSKNARALGCTVCVAGHRKEGRHPVDLAGLAERIDLAPCRPSADTEHLAQSWLRRVVEQCRPDLIQAHWLPGWGHVAVRIGERPVIATAWGSDVYLAGGVDRRRADWTLHHADAVIARSRHMEDEIRARGVAPELIHRVDLGVDLERFRPASSAERTRARSKLGLPPAGPVVLSLRAGTELYNLDVVIGAFRLLLRRRSDATLLLVTGDAPLASGVRSRLAQGAAAGIRVVGRVAHVAISEYLRAASVAVSIPSSDGSPNSVWEALAAGIPIVLSDLPQIEEKVHGCAAVRLVSPRPQAVAGALGDLIAGADRAELTAAARAWALEHVDERPQVGRLGEAYRSLCGERRLE